MFQRPDGDNEVPCHNFRARMDKIHKMSRVSQEEESENGNVKEPLEEADKFLPENDVEKCFLKLSPKLNGCGSNDVTNQLRGKVNKHSSIW